LLAVVSFNAVHSLCFGQPTSEPQLFAESVISTGDDESHLAFTPDGKTLYFLKNDPSFNHWTIVVSDEQDGKWIKPEVAAFSDADPFITLDGARLFFVSNPSSERESEGRHRYLDHEKKKKEKKGKKRGQS